jgi:hypothetical protein
MGFATRLCKNLRVMRSGWRRAGTARIFQLQQIGRGVGRLPRTAVVVGMQEPKLQHVEPTYEGLDRPHRIVALHIVLDTGRQEAILLTARAGLERAIRHTPNRILIDLPASLDFLHSLEAIPIIHPNDRSP